MLMNCPHCSAEVSSSAKFCPECGSPLSTTSPASPAEANHAALLQNYIPHELAKRILSAGKQIESERRLVTVVFADVSGFTAMSEKLDAEEVSTVLNDCFKGLISIVYKYEGVIDKFIGDEIMAIFGAPLTHENDPERALRCSMEMMEYMERFNQLSPVVLPEPLGLHISMNTGMVVAGNVGSDLRMNYSIIGDTVNLASRLKHVAERGEIVVSENTYKIISSLVNAEEPRMLDIKGKSEPAKVYNILSLKGGIEPGTRITQKSPIIGRDQEIGQLKNAIGQVLQKKEERLFIRGEAGVGKTRLKLELIQHAQLSGITSYEGRCSSFEINTPYYLWTTLLKNILQLKPDTGESETRKRLHDMLQILSMEKHEPYLATLLSLRYEEILLEEDQERKKRIYESLKGFLQALAQRKPSLFLLEDIHWIDRFSQDLLTYLFAEKDLAPAMFVTLFRDEYVHSRELIEKGGMLIDLNRLSRADAEKLMCARLQAEELPSNLSELLYKRSEGNPFFIEELVKTLLDKKIVTVKKQKLEILKTDFESILPETVHGVIMSRIDQLEEKLREVLYGASVIGREFDKSLLKEILKRKETVDPALAELLSLDLIFESEEAKELAYLFKHYLIQEVAYNTILQKKRKQLHKLIALAIEKVYAEKLMDFYELLSFHYEKAEEWEKAADYLNRAGRKMRDTFTQEESKGFTKRKDAALEQLFASEAEKSTWFFKLLSVAAFGLMTAMSLYALSGGAYLILNHLGLHIEIMDAITEPDPNSWVDGTIGLVMGVALAYLTLMLLKAYSALGRLRVFEVLDDGISLVFKGGERAVIQFSEVQSVSFVPLGGTESWSDHPIIKVFTLLGINHQPTLGMYRLMANRRVLSNKPGKEGYILLRRKKGISVVKAQMRIGTGRIKVIKNARNLGLTPAHTAQFYEQLLLAFTKWQTKHCVHCSEPIQASNPCASCGYVREQENTSTIITQREIKQVRPVQNSILDILEFVVAPQFASLFCCVAFLYEVTKWHMTMMIWFTFGLFSLLGLVALAQVTLILFLKRKSEKNLVISISEKFISYVGGSLYMKGLTIPLQDIVALRRYANLWQRLLGLGNIEMEIRNGLPFTKRGPIFYSVIPSIRESKEIEALLREKCFPQSRVS